jgi:HNH endonuclease
VLVIPDELLTRLQDRVKKINTCFPATKTDVISYTLIIIKKHLDKYDHQELNNQGKGVQWEIFIFRRNNFQVIYRRDNGQCHYCKKNLSRRVSTLDHKLPVTRNGANTLDNVVLSCKWCNLDKGALTDEEYYYKQLVNASKGIYPPK